MRVSVVIPTYNRAALVRACITSVLACGLSDVEPIVVDDGSTDETEAVVRGFGERVKYVRQSNAGPAAARNRGFEAGTGECVAFLDSDDVWNPGMAPLALEVLERHADVPVVFTDAAMGPPDGRLASVVETFAGDAFRALPGRELQPNVRRFERGPFLHLLVRRNFVFLGSALFRRRVVERSGGFDSARFGGEDWEFVLRLASAHEFVFREGPPLARYQVHGGGISSDQDRMNREFAAALSGLLARGRLTPAERRFVRAEIARKRFDLGWEAYDRGDLVAARAQFASSLRHGIGLRSIAYYLASHLPAGAIGRARAMKRRLVG
jgi:glycosyltransferase involved in cell wall biosynthesis